MISLKVHQGADILHQPVWLHAVMHTSILLQSGGSRINEARLGAHATSICAVVRWKPRTSFRTGDSGTASSWVHPSLKTYGTSTTNWCQFSTLGVGKTWQPLTHAITCCGTWETYPQYPCCSQPTRPQITFKFWKKACPTRWSYALFHRPSEYKLLEYWLCNKTVADSLLYPTKVWLSWSPAVFFWHIVLLYSRCASH